MRKILLIGWLCLVGISAVPVQGQFTSPDSVWAFARKLAENKKYGPAIDLMESLVMDNPQNGDYGLYLARLYSWSEKPDAAFKVMERFGWGDSPSGEPLEVLIQIQTQRGKTDEVIALCKSAQEEFPSRFDEFQLKKANALAAAGRDQEALSALNSIVAGSESANGATYLRTQVLKKRKNAISAGYLIALFDDPQFDPLQLAHLEYTRKIRNHAVVGRLNYGNMFNEKALQAEVDGYIKLAKSNYVYLNTGFSDGKSVFPVVRLGGELYHEKKHYSLSAGGRLLHFDNNNTAGMLTGHLAGHWHNWSLTYRPFWVKIDRGWLMSHAVNVRKTFEAQEAFIQADLQYGSLPYYFFTTEVFSRLDAYRLGIHGQFRIKEHFFVHPILMYEWEEYFPDQFRNRYNCQLILTKRF